MLIIGLILFGMIIGAAAQWLLGTSKGKKVDWALACAAGLIGSFVGGLLISLLSGDGLELRPSGIIGSLAGAVIVTAIWVAWNRSRAKK
ncbi:GlsB/YeaQ/YmgE family stress response membrane protein [Microbacterium bovistercoris]|uniref:GlsB/YeaQ/YmgE family stress response membrane protein n=1 Tax=Microbacterium bovistercoris TaxID=2293570 RepID=A0A371NTI4_9MICO|nr:GlsB/YeaQ/YmgE family stress response membrane protein [Microbacterium bovistercoris]REJ05012.1 GlsB/YeaQ/YmgE family stress response membrane protein [Microbacterium bovistercoris]